MTSKRLYPPAGSSPARTCIALLLLLGTAAAFAAASACGGDDTTANTFLGVTDAEAPRLGSGHADGGATR
jgi:hypothetical protein